MLNWLGHDTHLDGQPLKRVQIATVAAGMNEAAPAAPPLPYLAPIVTPYFIKAGRISSRIQGGAPDPRDPRAGG